MLLLFASLSNLGGKMNQIEVAPAVVGASPVIYIYIYIFILLLFVFVSSHLCNIQGGSLKKLITTGELLSKSRTRGKSLSQETQIQHEVPAPRAQQRSGLRPQLLQQSQACSMLLWRQWQP